LRAYCVEVHLIILMGIGDAVHFVSKYSLVKLMILWGFVLQ
jgi:hypothetical protein